MFDIDKWQEIILIMSKHKLRTILTAFGVFWGIFMLMILLGAGTGLENGVKQMFRGAATNSIFLWTSQTSMPYKGMKKGRRLRLTNDDTYAIRNQVKGVEYVAPRVWVPVETVTRGGATGSFTTYGDSPDFIKIEQKDLYAGRFINETDIEERRKVAVIGERVAELLFKKDEKPVGDYIKINGIFFKVIGVFKSLRAGEQSMDQIQSIHIPVTTAQQISNMGNRVGWYAMTVNKNTPSKKLEKQVKSLLANRHKVHPDDKRAFGSWNMEQTFKQFDMMFIMIRSFTWFVGVLTLIAGVVGISNIMLIAVKERTREFGLRKALGATPGHIISLVLQEAVLLTAVAGYTGMVVGVFLIEGISKLMDKFDVEAEFFANPEINFKAAMLATIVLVITGSLAGLIPATHAANIKPIEALRSE